MIEPVTRPATAVGPGEAWKPPVMAAVRRTVRALLEASPGWQDARPALRHELAHSLVAVGMMAADLAATDPAIRAAPLTAQALEAAPAPFSATRNAGRTIGELRKALDFPEYVSSLITGVFQAIATSNLAQLTALSDLLDNVAKTADEFTSDNIRDDSIVQWAVGKLTFLTTSDGSDLVVREGAELSERRGEIKAALGASDGELDALDAGDLMGTLGPLIKRKIGKERQQILGTLVQMGLQRIVIDEGRLHASMDMRVDTRSIAESERAGSQQFSMDTGASAQFGAGGWGAAGHMNVGFNKVSSEQDVSKDEIATRAALRSSVDLAFRTEQVPLDKMVGPAARVKLDSNSRVPASVAEAGTELLSPVTSSPHLSATAPTLTKSQVDVAPTPPALAKQPARAKSDTVKIEKPGADQAKKSAADATAAPGARKTTAPGAKKTAAPGARTATARPGTASTTTRREAKPAT